MHIPQFVFQQFEETTIFSMGLALTVIAIIFGYLGRHRTLQYNPNYPTDLKNKVIFIHAPKTVMEMDYEQNQEAPPLVNPNYYLEKKLVKGSLASLGHINESGAKVKVWFDKNSVHPDHYSNVSYWFTKHFGEFNNVDLIFGGELNDFSMDFIITANTTQSKTTKREHIVFNGHSHSGWKSILDKFSL